MNYRFNAQKRFGGERSFTTGVLWKQMLLYMVPVMLGSLLQQLYSTVDTIIVGRYLGVEALAAVGGSTSTVTTLLINFFAGLSAGAAAVVAQDFGADDKIRREKSVSSALFLGLSIGFALMLVGEGISPWLLRFMAVPDGIYPLAIRYLRIYMLGMIPIALFNMGSAVLNSIGDSRSSFVYLAISCVTNILLDLLLVGAFNLGIGGAAAATCAAQALSAVLIFINLRRTGILTTIKLIPSRISAKRILNIGMPGGLQSGLYSVANMVIQWAVNQYSITNVAAGSAYERVEGIFWTIMIALGVAVTTFTGQNYGAGKMDRMRKSVRIAMGFGCGVAVLIGAIAMIFANPICGLFTTDPETVENTKRILFLLMPFCITYVPTEVFGGAIKGCGDGVHPMILTLLFTCCFRIIWVIGCTKLGLNSFMLILACYPASWVVSSAAFSICYFRKRWLKIQPKHT